MNALLKKDMITSKNPLIIMNLLVGCVMVVLTIIGAKAPVYFPIYTFATLFIPIILNKFTATEETRKYYDMLINSFPVDRKDVVVSKYTFYLLVYFITSIFLLSIIFVLGKISGEDLKMLLFSQSFSFLYYVVIICVPNYIFYKASYDVAVKYSGFTLLGIIYLPMLVIFLAEKIFPSASKKVVGFFMKSIENGFLIIPLIFLIGLVIYGIITTLSIKGYCNKDLS